MSMLKQRDGREIPFSGKLKAAAVTDLTMVIASTESAKSGSINIKAQIDYF